MSNENTLKRQLNPMHVWAIAFGCVIGWGSFINPGKKFLPNSGVAGTAIAMVLGARVMIIIAASYAYMVPKYPKAGGEFTFAKACFGKGAAYYLCARADKAFYRDLYEEIADDLDLERALDGAILPENVSASLRKGECDEVAIVMNFNTESKTISLEYPVTDLESGEKTTHIMLAPYQVRFLRKETI